MEEDTLKCDSVYLRLKDRQKVIGSEEVREGRGVVSSLG